MFNRTRRESTDHHHRAVKVDDPYMRAQTAALADLARAHLGWPARQLHLLDVGCATGDAEVFLCRRFCSTVAVEIDPEPLAAARERGFANTRFVRADARSAPQMGALGRGAFDVASGFSLLHHLDEAGRLSVLQNLAQVVRPGGLVVMFEYNPLNPVTRLWVGANPADRDSVLLSPLQMTDLMHRAGLWPVEQRHLLFVPGAPRWSRPVEHKLRKVPLGAKYLVAARTTT